MIEAVEVTDEGIHIVRLMKVFDASSLDEFEKVLAYLLAHDNYRIVVDLTNVEFISSAGWGAFTAELRRVRDNGGDIRLAGMNPDVLDVFLLLELDSFINAYDTVDDAILSFGHSDHGPAGPQAPAVATASSPEPPNREAAVPDWLLGHEFKSPAAEAPLEGEEQVTDAPALSSDNAEFPEMEESDGRDAEVDPGYGSAYAPSLQDMLSGNANAFVDYAEDLPAAEEGEAVTRSSADETGGSSADGWHLDIAQEQLSQDEAEANHVAGEEAASGASSTLLPETEPSWQESGVPPATPAPEPASTEAFFEEYVLQDINDPWILDEIDRLPEEYEMEEVSWEGGRGFTNDSTPVARPQSQDEPVTPANVWDTAQKHAGNFVPAGRSSEVHTDAGSLSATVLPAPPQPAVETKPAERWPQPFAAAPPTTRTVSNRESVPAAAAAEQRYRTGNGPQPIRQSHAVTKTRFEGDRQAIIRQIVSQHPHYGPTMIQKYLEVRTEPAILVSRSTVYRWLRQAGLNTREQRLQFAGRAAVV
ncbi:MAG: anti-sigma factor antagonist [candidate division KSB1 bacterium]|nr:anti-sigma factor antagonist [candidate division KSB1 bacterium]